jgi:solute carrier family 25 oxoglutarate transporter 11
VEAGLQEVVNNPIQGKNDFLHLPLVRAALPFINGGLSGMFATACIQPIDMAKIRLQLAGEGGSNRAQALSIWSCKRYYCARKGPRFVFWYFQLACSAKQSTQPPSWDSFDAFQNILAARAEKNGTEVNFGERAAACLTAGGLAGCRCTALKISLPFLFWPAVRFGGSPF